MWVSGHVGIVGNEVADRVPGVARELPHGIGYGLPFCDLHDPIGRDFEAWVRLLWPYTETGGASCPCYFNRVAYKSVRPWFSRVSAPRRSICLISRLHTGHLCTGDHFQRMGWDLEAGCSCGAPLRALAHVLHACPLLAKSRPGYYTFLSERFPDRRPEEIPIEDLVFDPGPAVVGALAGHLGVATAFCRLPEGWFLLRGPDCALTYPLLGRTVLHSQGTRTEQGWRLLSE